MSFYILPFFIHKELVYDKNIKFHALSYLYALLSITIILKGKKITKTYFQIYKYQLRSIDDLNVVNFLGLIGE